MLITCVMRNARAHKLQWSGPTVQSSTVAWLTLVMGRCETVTLLLIYSKALFEWIIDQYNVYILL